MARLIVGRRGSSWGLLTFTMVCAALLCWRACAGVGMRTLELKDVQNFSVVETRREGVVFLRISGLAFHSALAVDHIETSTTNDTLMIKVLLSPARKGKSGRFEHVVEVPPAIQRVVFGDDMHQIWSK